jgi:hypothetical protein
MGRPATWACTLLVLSATVTFAQASAKKTSRIVGVVADSLHRTGLQGAEVLATGMTSPAITDSLGGFRLENLSAGTYQVGVFHPLLESLGITLATKPFNLGPDSTVGVLLAIPSAATLAVRYCGAAVTPGQPAVVVGRVLDADNDMPVAGAKVALLWVDMIVSKQTGVIHTPHELDARSDSSGFFRFCGLTEDLDATVQATYARISTGEVAVSTHGTPLTFENLTVPSTSSLTPVTGAVRGTVLSLDDRPVQGARVEVPMWGAAVLTDKDGNFSLDHVPIGTQLLLIRRVGFEPARTAVNVTSRQPVEMRVTLGPVVNLLDPVLVTARRNYTLDRSGFTAREHKADGVFFTSDDIQKRNPQYITDMLHEVPGIRVDHVPGGTSIRTDMITAISGGHTGGRCPTVWVDGNQWRSATDQIDDFVFPSEVVGLEVYKPGRAPVQFRDVDDCITLVIWTELSLPRAQR